MRHKFIYVSLAILSILGLSVSSTNAFASHHHAGVRVTARIRGKRSHYKTKKTRSYIGRTKGQIYRQMLKDINHYRKLHHKRPVKINHHLNWVANQRAKQLESHYSHDFHGHEAYFKLYKEHHPHMKSNVDLGENIGFFSPDIQMSGHKISHLVDSDMMYHDQACHNMHRFNFLYGGFNHVGLGVSYHNGNFYIVEDFADL